MVSEIKELLQSRSSELKGVLRTISHCESAVSGINSASSQNDVGIDASQIPAGGGDIELVIAGKVTRLSSCSDELDSLRDVATWDSFTIESRGMKYQVALRKKFTIGNDCGKTAGK